MPLPTYPIDHDINLDPIGTWPLSVHRFDADTAAALRAAEAAGRLFVSVVIDGRSEAQDLLWRYDAVGRLSDAHAPGTHAKAAGHYISPGPLWWVYVWAGAEAQWNLPKQGDRPELPPGWQPEKGAVLLIDEIDKADPDLPNAFLEVLGNQGFGVPFLGQRVVRGATPPLVVIIITTNEERDLPAAFLRRCFVHILKPPADLVGLGRRHLERRA